MPINLTVRAEVVDVRSDTPKTDDAFLVDTNVWQWLVYSRCMQVQRRPTLRQRTDYPQYINRVIAAGSRLIRCGFTFAELVHLIEKTEREIYSQATGEKNAKEFRHNFPTERAKVVNEVQTAWNQIKALASPADLTVDDPVTDAALTRFQSQPVDGYDLFILETASKSQITQVVTDDCDYCTVPGIRVFTSHQAVLTAAAAQGKLVVR